MTTSSRNYNVLALRGGDVDDMEYVEEFGVPKEYAHSKKLNDYMLDKVQTENENMYIKDGMSNDEAKSKARYNRMNAENDINDLYKLNEL